jgi:hypothetical protein
MNLEGRPSVARLKDIEGLYIEGLYEAAGGVI